MDLSKLFLYGQSGIKNILYTDANITTRNQYDVNEFRTQVIVVGCGGTGGRVIPVLAQHIKNHNTTFETTFNNSLYLKHKIALTLIDADDIEVKNLRRQNFFTFDVGKYKAEVMAERYGALYGMEIGYYNDIFNKDQLSGGMTNYIIFDCTDNKEARKSIEAALVIPYKNVIIISCGNEDDFGQVLVAQNKGNYTAGGRSSYLMDEFKAMDKVIQEPDPKAKTYMSNVPTLLEIFKDWKDTVKPSCTDITLIDDQSMPINSLVAQLAYNVFYLLVAGKNLNYHMVKCNINNTYSTNFVTYPGDALSLITRGILGDGSTEAVSALRAFSNASPRNTVDSIIDLFNSHDRKYTEQFYSSFIAQNYNFNSTPANFERLNWRK